MTNLRQAALQALEFLDEEFGWSPGEAPRVDALRAALAQEQAEPVQEPVPGVVLNEEGRAALVEYGREEWHCAARNARRLYTAPPKREPLTEEEIIDATEHIDTSRNGYFIDIARAVERAHGIGDSNG